MTASPSPGVAGTGPLRARLVRAWDAAASRPALSAFAVALGARVVVAVALRVVAGGTVFPDDASYVRFAAAIAAGGETGLDPAFLESVAAFLYPVAGLFRVLTPDPLLGQVLVGAVGAATAAVTARLVLEALDARWALAAGLVVALFPSQVFWSSLVLKDAFGWLATSLLALVVAVAGRSDGRRLATLAVAAALLVAGLMYVRQFTMIVAAWALALSAMAGQRRLRLVRGAGGIALLVAVPWLVGAGPAGLDIATVGAGDATAYRARSAEGAATATVEQPAEIAHDTEPATLSSLRDDLSHLPAGIATMLLRPYPGTSLRSNPQRAALVEHLVWYPLLAFAVLGLPSLRQRSRVLLFPLLAGGALLVMYALVEGNFGTAYRHRSEFLWVVAVFAVFGMRRVRAWRARTAT